MLTRPAWRISAFAVGLAVVLAAGFGIGRLAGPIATADDEHGGAHADGVIHLSPPSSYDLVLEEPTSPAGARELAFTIRDAAGKPVTSYDVQHAKELHLILVRADLGGYRHVHPVLDEETGRWSVPVTLEPGDWRAYADFAPAGEEPALAEADLAVGDGESVDPLGPDTDTATVDDYEVHLTRDGSAVVLHVTRDGREVTDLQPYLGSFGHLVAIRAEDLAYLHVHPEEGEAGPEVGFHAEFATPGRYRLFFDFKHDGTVRTAVFTITVDGSATAPEDHPGEHEEGGHEH